MTGGYVMLGRLGQDTGTRAFQEGGMILGTAAGGVATFTSGAEAGTAAAAAGTAATIALPIIGAVALVGTLIFSWMAKRNAQKTMTTAVVNEAEPYMKQNLDAFQAGPQTPEAQAVALQNFDNIWSQVVKECARESFGAPGRNCIEDRMSVGVTVHTYASDTGVEKTYVGNGKWPWDVYYRNPIANAAVTEPSVADTVSSLATSPGPGGLPLGLLIGGALLAVGALS